MSSTSCIIIWTPVSEQDKASDQCHRRACFPSSVLHKSERKTICALERHSEANISCLSTHLCPSVEEWLKVSIPHINCPFKTRISVQDFDLTHESYVAWMTVFPIYN